uniref:hypothetical protein n=1 Tax=Methylibium sp. TaxID=2067992 RepID=UPI001796C21C
GVTATASAPAGTATGGPVTAQPGRRIFAPLGQRRTLTPIAGRTFLPLGQRRTLTARAGRSFSPQRGRTLTLIG